MRRPSPDEAQGERVKAFVVPEDPSQASRELERELIAHCRERLIKWSCPRDVEFREELPRTRLGKLDFKALADQGAEHPARDDRVTAARANSPPGRRRRSSTLARCVPPSDPGT